MLFALPFLQIILIGKQPDLYIHEYYKCISIPYQRKRYILIPKMKGGKSNPWNTLIFQKS